MAGRREKVYRERTDYFEEYTDQEFYERTRFSKEVATLIVNGFADSPYGRKSGANHACTDAQTVTIALRYFATGSMYREQGDCGGVSRSTVGRKVHSVSQYLVSIMEEWIHFPLTPQERFRTAQKFNEYFLPRCIGAIDCSHFYLCAPNYDENAYVNRKFRHSLNVQAVINGDMLFTNVDARWPGSTHDSFIFTNSSLGMAGANGNYGDYFLIGDKGYPNRKWLLRPYAAAVQPAEIRFNTAHKIARSLVERAFGRLKMRFRCLSKTGGVFMTTPLRAANVIVSCMVLHNIAEVARLPLPEEEDQEQGGNAQDLPQQNEQEQNEQRGPAGAAALVAEGIRVRDAVANGMPQDTLQRLRAARVQRQQERQQRRQLNNV